MKRVGFQKLEFQYQLHNDQAKCENNYFTSMNYLYMLSFKKITDYLVKLKQLSADDEDSLQVNSCHPYSSLIDCLVNQS